MTGIRADKVGLVADLFPGVPSSLDHVRDRALRLVRAVNPCRGRTGRGSADERPFKSRCATAGKTASDGYSRLISEIPFGLVDVRPEAFNLAMGAGLSRIGAFVECDDGYIYEHSPSTDAFTLTHS